MVRQKPLPKDPVERVTAKAFRALDPEAAIAWKILSGIKLDPDEYEAATYLRYFSTAPSYKNYMASMYEDEKRQGQLCGRVASTKTARGETFCAFGIHACNVDPKALTPENRVYLAAFGWTEDQFGTGDRYQTPKAQIGERVTSTRDDPDAAARSEEYDPGPEIDDQGGMSEYGHDDLYRDDEPPTEGD